MFLEKLPSVLQLSSLRRPIGFSAERHPNSQRGGNDLTEREILLEHTDNRLCRVWALDKTLLNCQARLRRSGGKGNVIICIVWTARSRLGSARPCTKLKLVQGRCKSEIRTHHFSTNGNGEEFSWVQKNLKYQWACLNEADRRSGQSGEQRTLWNHKHRCIKNTDRLHKTQKIFYK